MWLFNGPVKVCIVLIFWILPFGSGCDGHSPPDSSDTPSPLLLISIDGLMPGHLDAVPTPFIDKLIADGGKAGSLIPVFPSKTFPVHYSIVTGLYPGQHGIISNTFDDPELGSMFRYGSPQGSTPDDWWGGEPIWVTAEKASQTTATLFWPGSDEKIRGVRPTRYSRYDGSVSHRDRIDQLAEWIDPSGEVAARFSTLYFSEVDHAGHQYGPYAEETLDKVEEIDSDIGYLIERLKQVGLFGDINILLLSDHGMVELSEDRVIFLDSLIDLERVDISDWTPVAMIRPKEGKKEEVYARLSDQEQGYRVYRKSELPDRYRFKEHARIPGIVMVADLGYTITSRSYYYGRGLLAGMHGYDPEYSEMHGVFITHGPDFRSGSRMAAVHAIDLYESMCRLLGLEPAANEGSPGALNPLLK